MPTYEYECLSCSHQFEQSQSMTADPIKICPICQGTVKRLISRGGGIILKGSGFYQTDYRSSAYQKQAQADKKPSESAPKPSVPSGGSDSASPKP
jgi:putative FmdB family regulatory protein